MDTLTLDEMIDTARNLVGDSVDSNPEYVRGIAEFIVDITPGLNQNSHKSAILALIDTRIS